MTTKITDQGLLERIQSNYFERTGRSIDRAQFAGAVAEALREARSDYGRAAEEILEEIQLHGRDERFPCHALADADCVDLMRERARVGLVMLRDASAMSTVLAFDPAALAVGAEQAWTVTFCPSCGQQLRPDPVDVTSTPPCLGWGVEHPPTRPVTVDVHRISWLALGRAIQSAVEEVAPAASTTVADTIDRFFAEGVPLLDRQELAGQVVVVDARAVKQLHQGVRAAIENEVTEAGGCELAVAAAHAAIDRALGTSPASVDDGEGKAVLGDPSVGGRPADGVDG